MAKTLLSSTTFIVIIASWCYAHPRDYSRTVTANHSGDAYGVKSYSGYKLFRADVTLAELSKLDSMSASHDVEVWSRKSKSGHLQYEVDVMTSPEDKEQVLQVFSEYKLPYQEVIHDLQKAIDEEMEVDRVERDKRSIHPMTWDSYHSLEDMYEYMEYLRDNYPKLVTLVEIGRSFENRSLLAAKVSSGPNKPAIFIDGGMHAREWISPATTLYILKQLVEFHFDYEEIVGKFDWYVLPVVNPDGYEFTRSHDRLWRKTRSVNQNTNCIGVDPNRNFGYQWYTGGASNDPCSVVYAGTHAFSESEVKAVGGFLMENKDQLKAYVNIHSFSQMWLLPYGFSSKRPDNYRQMYDVAQMAAEAIHAHGGTEYAVGTVVDILYTASGNSIDYAHGEAKIPFSYSIELRDTGSYGFLLPKDQILPTSIETFEGIKAMAKGVYRRISEDATLDPEKTNALYEYDLSPSLSKNSYASQESYPVSSASKNTIALDALRSFCILFYFICGRL